MRKRQKKVLFLFVAVACLVAGVFAAPPTTVAAVQRALSIDDPALVNYAVRVRATGQAMSFIRRQLITLLSTWENPESSELGANKLLDPGYNFEKHNAGIVRNTPIQWSYATSNIQRTSDYVCKSCIGKPEEFSYLCGQTCTNTGTTFQKVGWSQVRKPGFSNADIPTVISQAGGYNGFGFYVPGRGGDFDACTGNAFDFYQQQICTPVYNYDVGGGHVGACTGQSVKDVLIAGVNIDYNVRLSIFPNMWAESGGCVDNSQEGTPCDNTKRMKDPSYPAFAPGYTPGAPARGCFTGIDSMPSTPAPVVNQVAFQAQACSHGATSCVTDTQACCATDWTGGCTERPYVDAVCAAKTTLAGQARIPQPPNPPVSGPYDSAGAYSQTHGVYFRQGDDQTFYLNYYQMQLQSYDRPFFAPEAKPDCNPNEVIYNGKLGTDGQPQYILTGQPVRNCMRPKMYFKWADPTSIDPKQTRDHWQQCNAFDTWRTDGTYNASNDDAKYVYPANPNTGAPFSHASPGPGVCGSQKCTAYDNTVFNGPPATWNKAPCNGNDSGGVPFPDGKRRTNRLEDTYEPGLTVIGGTYAYTDPANNAYRYNGSGWYAFKVSPFVYNPVNDTIAVSLSSAETRLEVAAAADLTVTIMLFGNLPVRLAFSDQVLFGVLSVKSLALNATIGFRGIDNTSCNPSVPATCANPWTSKQDNLNNPQILNVNFNVPEVGGVKINRYDTADPIPPDTGNRNWLNGQSTASIDLIIIAITVGDVMNISFIADMLIPIIEGAVQDMIGPELGNMIAGAVPPLGTIFGNPISMGTVLVEPGIYPAGTASAKTGTPEEWPAPILAGPTNDRSVIDLRFMMGFKPIAFLKDPVGPNRILQVDPNDPPLNDSFYGIPTLINPATTGCTYVNPASCAPLVGCNIPIHGITVDSDQQYDLDEYCIGGTGSYVNPVNGSTVSINYPSTIPEYWQMPVGGIAPDKKPPSWCMSAPELGINMPATLRRTATPAVMKSLYPANTWLSFDSTYDLNPSGARVPKNTFGDWDEMRANSVLAQNNNSGARDPSRIGYDLSAHIHQRTIAEFLQLLVATGATCIEFASKDADGNATPWASMLKATAFAAFVPEINSLFPNSDVKVRVSPMTVPHARTGMGRLSYTPHSRTKDPVWGAQPIVNQPYTLSVALPDVRIEIVADDHGSEVPILTMYWNTAVGIYAKAIRTCLPVDPLFGQPACASTDSEIRTVSGYWEFFVDLNSPTLAAAWENGRDGFLPGKFTNPGVGLTKDEAAFSIYKSFCQLSSRCDMIGLSQAVPTLLNSMISLFLVTRFSFDTFTVDFLYMGPDGPNDDLVGGGDYLGLYFRFLGKLNLLGMLSDSGVLAPKTFANRLQPAAHVEGADDVVYSTVNSPRLPVTLTSPVGPMGVESALSYTYRVDKGFWRTPVADKEMVLGTLTEGRHSVELRAIDDTDQGTIAAMTPTTVNLVVDTIAPEVTIKPAKKGIYKKRVELAFSDLQTPADEIKRAYRWNSSAEWTEFEGDTISVRGRPDGRNTLHVRATDQAGNASEAARVVNVEDGSWSCSSSAEGGGTQEFALVFAFLFLFRFARRRVQ